MRMGGDAYILGADGRTPVPVEMKVWAQACENRRAGLGESTAFAGRARVGDTDCGGDVRVSTVFLGLDHSWVDSSLPVVFETLVFGGEHDGYMKRYSTWEAAEQGHLDTIIMCGWKLEDKQPEAEEKKDEGFKLVKLAEHYTDVTQGESE